jgi:hypothetical protein
MTTLHLAQVLVRIADELLALVRAILGVRK